MLTLIKNLNPRALSIELPAFLVSMLVAEFVFKFHSFTLECLAFLALWSVLSAVFSTVVKPK